MYIFNLYRWPDAVLDLYHRNIISHVCEAYVILFLFGSFFTVCHPYIDLHFVKCFFMLLVGNSMGGSDIWDKYREYCSGNGEIT